MGEHNIKKNALIKCRLCPDCSYKLNDHHKKKELTKKRKKNKKKKKRKKRSRSSSSSSESDSSDDDSRRRKGKREVGRAAQALKVTPQTMIPGEESGRERIMSTMPRRRRKSCHDRRKMCGLSLK